MTSYDHDIVRILLNTDSSDWLVVANSNQDCELTSNIPVLFGEDVDTSCDLKYVAIVTKIFIILYFSKALLM